jgi:heptosyltransferase-2
MVSMVGKKFDKSAVRRILVRATNWVGDVVMTLPALEAIRETFPTSTISVLAKPWVVPLLENHPAVDNVIPYRKKEGRAVDLYELIRIVRLIRGQDFDLAILFQNAFEAGLLAYLGGVKFRLGYNTDGRGFLLNYRIKRSEAVLKAHQVEYYLFLLRAVGWEGETRDPSLHLAEKDLEKAKALLRSKGVKEGDFLIGLSPGAIFGEAKRWPPERFARIGDWAVERWKAKALIMGSQKEMHICKALERSMSHRALDLSGQTTLGEAAALVRQCQFFLSNDSGLMHIAAALGVPTMAVFGSTNPVTTGPRGLKTRIVRHQIECAPCLKPECPTDHRCMLSIEPEEVWEAMETFRRELE